MTPKGVAGEGLIVRLTGSSDLSLGSALVKKYNLQDPTKLLMKETIHLFKGEGINISSINKKRLPKKPLLRSGFRPLLAALCENSKIEKMIMKMRRTVVIMSILSVLSGCGQESKNVEEKQEQKGVIPQGHLDALNKAKGMEQSLKEAEEKRRKEMERKGA